MPTYEYECKKCGQHFEAFQKMSDDALDKCPKKNCDGKVKRIISGGTGIIFKGPGFYVNDYAKPGTSRKEMEAKEKAKAEP